MEEQFDKARILARVKKMMTLANDAAATEGERDNAMRMAHATLAKYNLTMAQADASGRTSEEQRVDNAITLREYAWMRNVAANIGKLFFCDFFLTPLQKKHAMYVFVGKESNVYTASEMAKYIIRSIDQEGINQARCRGETPRGTYWRDFCKGAGYRVGERCRELVAAAERASQTGSTGTSLVLASVYASELVANRRYILIKMNIKLTTGKNRQRAPGAAGWHAGREFGNGLGLNNQLTNKG